MDVGIWGYGVSVPLRRIAIEQIHNVWQNVPLPAVKARGVKERVVLGADEDTVTLAVDAATKALRMSGLGQEKIGALILGTQTSPYLTRPSASILVEAIGLRNDVFAADIQFSGKSGTSALLLALAYVSSGMAEAAIAVGADTLSPHVSPGDSQEYTASSGAGALVIGKGEGIVKVEASASYTTDTPDYFRLDGERYIRTGGAAMTNTDVGMENNVTGAWESLNRLQAYSPDSFKYLVIQQDDGRVPFRIGQKLGFSKDQISPGIIADQLGDCGSASTLISLAKVINEAGSAEKIAVLSYGPGAGSDALVLRTTEEIGRTKREAHVTDIISRKTMVDYATYIKMERKYYTHERKVTTFD
jgi:3-hydroxy-3-methylglutaryl CoA synthase